MTDANRPLRAWREIAHELFNEPNTARMLILLQELTEAFEQQRSDTLNGGSKESEH